MNELITAAKAVIESLYDLNYEKVVNLKNLEQAVERAKKQEAVGFDDWWDANADIEMMEVAIHKWDECSTA